MSEQLQAILQTLRQALRDLYKERLAALVLFGSQARGDAASDSDIDVLVVLKGEVNAGEEIERTSPILNRLSLENDVALSCIYMDEQRFQERNGPLLRNIRREGVPL